MSGEELRGFRLSIPLTQLAISKALGISLRTVIRWEHGTFTPRPVDLENLFKLQANPLIRRIRPAQQRLREFLKSRDGQL